MVREAWARIVKWAVCWIRLRPHFIVGSPEQPYLLRYYVIPRNPFLNIYLHKFLRDDDDRAMHDHPWLSLSILIAGKYVEQTAKGRRLYHAGSVIIRQATHTHRIELPQGEPAWTLFITGPRQREWGFHCPQGWVHFKVFTEPTNYGQVGKGCEQ
jgi:hypothetical protein